MVKDKPGLIFASRVEFRHWLNDNVTTGAGVWLVFSKSKDFLTVSATGSKRPAVR